APRTRVCRGGIEAKQVLLKDIGAKWIKFSEQELGALKNRDNLVDHCSIPLINGDREAPLHD
ncbi:MAG: hypothetical protein P8183_18365, partial [Anaerolineae bacterium]